MTNDRADTEANGTDCSTSDAAGAARRRPAMVQATDRIKGQGTRPTRYYLVDAIRGAAIVSMVAFHLCYDIFIVYGRDPQWYGVPAVRVWQQTICWTFIAVSGFVWVWGKRSGNVRRGLMLNGFGLVISLVTVTIMPSEAVWFGILNFIGCAILLMIPMEPLLARIPAAAGLAGSFLLFLACRDIPSGRLGIPGLAQVPVPQALYDIAVLTPLGFPAESFHSSDYFPILPWMLLYVCGYFLHRVFMRHASWQRAARHRVPGLTALGTKAIWIYLIHQPVCILICELLLR